MQSDFARRLSSDVGGVSCPLAREEKALETVLRNSQWSYLAPLRGIKPLWRELREPQYRLKKAGAERLKDGSIAKNPQHLGPLTFEGRLMALDRILAIQNECNAAARAQGRPEISLIDAWEETRIRELIALETWPHGGDGNEPTR
ncbi:DNA sulfur modification protein DndC [Ralstonia sp. 25mfcol4.1]|nr:DNA sulfur modification protein DndC [Ralstonia sp. 25mfcol4.1]